MGRKIYCLAIRPKGSSSPYRLVRFSGEIGKMKMGRRLANDYTFSESGANEAEKRLKTRGFQIVRIWLSSGLDVDLDAILNEEDML